MADELTPEQQLAQAQTQIEAYEAIMSHQGIDAAEALQHVGTFADGLRYVPPVNTEAALEEVQEIAAEIEGQPVEQAPAAPAASPVQRLQAVKGTHTPTAPKRDLETMPIDEALSAYDKMIGESKRGNDPTYRAA